MSFTQSKFILIVAVLVSSSTFSFVNAGLFGKSHSKTTGLGKYFSGGKQSFSPYIGKSRFDKCAYYLSGPECDECALCRVSRAAVPPGFLGRARKSLTTFSRNARCDELESSGVCAFCESCGADFSMNCFDLFQTPTCWPEPTIDKCWECFEKYGSQVFP